LTADVESVDGWITLQAIIPLILAWTESRQSIFRQTNECLDEMAGGDVILCLPPIHEKNEG